MSNNLSQRQRFICTGLPDIIATGLIAFGPAKGLSLMWKLALGARRSVILEISPTGTAARFNGIQGIGCFQMIRKRINGWIALAATRGNCHLCDRRAQKPCQANPGGKMPP